MLITMNVNGKKVDIDVSYDEYLVDTLRRIGNLSVKRGCDTGYIILFNTICKS